MGINYAEVDGTVLVNLRDDTLSSASQVAEGVTAHLRTGEKVTGTGGAGVPTEVRQAIYRLFNDGVFASSTGHTADISTLQSWATEVTDITISKSYESITGAGTSQLTAVTVPTGGLVTWSSSNPAVATVSNTGLVTGVSNGTARIMASCGEKKATCDVTVSGFATLTGITATYTQSGTVYATDDLDDLKSDLVVVGNYSDSTTEAVTDYTLSGTLASGTSTITAHYGGFIATFNVTVSSAPPLYTLKQGTISMSSGNSCTLSDGNHCEVVTTSNGRMAYLNQTKGQNGAPQNFTTTIFTLSQGDEWEFRVKNIEFASNTDAANYFAIRLYNLANATDVASGQMAYSELTPGTLADVTATGTIETATNVTSVLFYFHRSCEFEFDFEFYVNGVRYL